MRRRAEEGRARIARRLKNPPEASESLFRFPPFFRGGARQMGKLTVTCLDWKAMRKGSLAGFAQIRVAELSLIVDDVAVHETGARRWAQLPARPWVHDGALVLERGKIQYSPTFRFERREVADAFSAAVIRAVLDRYPQAFESAEAPA
jgi:hypothetical protein